MKLPKLTSINNNAINLTKNKQTLSGLVYKLGEARNPEDVYQDLVNPTSKSQVKNLILFFFRKNRSLCVSIFLTLII